LGFAIGRNRPYTAAESIDLIEIHRSSGLADISNLRLTLSEAKELLARVQQTMVAARARGSSAIVHVLLGPMSPQGLAAAADRDAVQRGGAEVAAMALCRLRTDRNWPENCRSTPELNERHAHLSALLTYRVAAGVLAHLLPVETGTSDVDCLGPNCAVVPIEICARLESESGHSHADCAVVWERGSFQSCGCFIVTACDEVT
jgi:hypothetical protein